MKLIDPHHIELSDVQKLYNQGLSFLQAGQINKGIEILEKVSKLAPANVNIHYNLGKAYYVSDKFPEALKCFEKVLAHKQDHYDAYNYIGQIYYRQSNYADAEKNFLQALSIETAYLPALLGIATTLNHDGRGDEAIPYLEKAIKEHPQNSAPWVKLVALLEFTGQLDKALYYIEEAKSVLNEQPIEIELSNSKILRRHGKYKEAIDLLNTVIKRKEDYYSAHYEIARNFDLNKDYESAFHHFRLANAYQAKTPIAINTDASNLINRLHNLKEFISNTNFESLASGYNGITPVFIIGFPRSGTTLLDQILSSHSDINVIEEIPALTKARLKLGRAYPSDIQSLDDKDISELRAFYIKTLGVDESKPVNIDKMPLNIHDVLLAKLLFPNAKFLLCIRHPLDCILSCYMQEFMINNSMAQFLDLSKAAAFYDLTFEIWDTAINKLDLDFQIVKYEELVTDFESTCKNIISYLHLEWHDNLLGYNKTAKAKKVINTPSYSQVTQELNTQAINRWENYKVYLDKERDKAKKWITYFGY